MIQFKSKHFSCINRRHFFRIIKLLIPGNLSSFISFCRVIFLLFNDCKETVLSVVPLLKLNFPPGTLKNPTKCLWRWEPDRRSNFFFSPPAHLCAVTYVTEISLIVTLNNQFNSTTQPSRPQKTLVINSSEHESHKISLRNLFSSSIFIINQRLHKLKFPSKMYV